MASSSYRLASASYRLTWLRAEHARLDQDIRKEMSRPMPDSLVLTSLKQRKLRIKELIGRAAVADVRRQGEWQDWQFSGTARK